MHYNLNKLIMKSRDLVRRYLLQINARWRHRLERLRRKMASNTSMLGSKIVSGVHCVAPGCTTYFYKNVNVTFHRLPSDQLLVSDGQFQFNSLKPSSDPVVSESATR